MTFLNLILSIAKAVPVIDKWLEQLSSLYVKTRITSMKKENVEAITLAVVGADQRGVEKALGSVKAGQPSNLPGVEVRDNLPGVQ